MTTIALLGTGLLGAAIGHRLLEVGISLKVWNRDPDRCRSLVRFGALLCGSPADTLQDADTVVTVLRDGPVTAEVVQSLGPLQGRTVMPMGTMGISESVSLAQQVRTQGGRYLEAPVLGSRPEAQKGTLLVMAGGILRCCAASPSVEHLGSDPLRMGDVGTGAAAKLALNQLIASLTHGYSLALRLVQASGWRWSASWRCCVLRSLRANGG